MDPRKLKLLEEILSHLSDSQGGDLKSLLDESKKPQLPEVLDDGSSRDGLEDPKGIAVEKLKVTANPEKPDFDSKVDDAIADSDSAEHSPSEHQSGEEEMSDDELKELLGKYLG
jgi:hypothetical protein